MQITVASDAKNNQQLLPTSLDFGFREKGQKHRRPLPLSKLKERAGLRIKTQYALVKCICKERLIVKKGQQTRLCPFCNRRIWLADRRILFQSNDLKLLKKLVGLRPDNGQCVGYYHPHFMLLSHLCSKKKVKAGAKRKTEYRCIDPRDPRNPRDSRRHMLEEREKCVN